MKAKDLLALLWNELDHEMEVRCIFETNAAVTVNIRDNGNDTITAVGKPVRVIIKPPVGEEIPDPLQVLRDLFDAGHLEDHFYHVRDSEGLGWDGPRLRKWGNAVTRAQKLLKDNP